MGSSVDLSFVNAVTPEMVGCAFEELSDSSRSRRWPGDVSPGGWIVKTGAAISEAYNRHFICDREKIIRVMSGAISEGIDVLNLFSGPSGVDISTGNVDGGGAPYLCLETWMYNLICNDMGSGGDRIHFDLRSLYSDGALTCYAYGLLDHLRELYGLAERSDARDVDLVNMAMPRSGDGFISDILDLYFHPLIHAMWVTGGRKVYHVSPGLRIRLENTVLRGCPASDVIPPFSCFYLSLPAGKYYANEDGNGSSHNRAGVYVSHCVLGDGNRSLFFRYDSSVADHAVCFSLDLSDGKTVDESIYESKLSIGWDGNVDNDAIRLVRYVVNLILYATMSDADTMIVQSDPEYRKLFERAMRAPARSRKRKSILRRAKAISSSPHVVLGGKVYLDREIEELSGGECCVGTRGRSPMSVRTLVSGHWRNQAYGAGRSERKRIFIEPHWRGPEYAPVTKKIHVMKSGGV